MHCRLFGSVIDCFSNLTVYGADSSNMSLLSHHGSARRNRGMGVVIHGRIRTCYLCFTYTSVLTDRLILVDSQRMK